MTYSQVLDALGGDNVGKLKRAAKALRRAISTVQRWKKAGIPYGVQCEIERDFGAKHGLKARRG